MRKFLTVSIMFLALAVTSAAQDEFKPGGSGIGTIFFNYKYDLTDDVSQKSSFNLDRAYLGYKYDFTQSISAKVIFDVGYESNTKQYTAFAKNAFVDWTMCPHFKLSVGLIPVRHFELQEKVWGYRYIMKPVADEYGMGTTADLGVSAEIPVNKMLTFNAYLINGEGFKSLQDNFGMQKVGVNATLKPAEGLSLRLHYDMMANKYMKPVGDGDEVETDTSTVSVFSAFIGYEKKDVFRVGFDYNMMNNGASFDANKGLFSPSFKSPADGFDLTAFSVFGTYIFNPKWEIFARYDNVTSNEPEDFDQPWNLKDGSMVMGGIQYKATKNVNFALNYRTFMYKEKDWNGDDIDDAKTPSAIYVNMGIFF